MTAYLVALLGRVRVSARAWAWAQMLAAIALAASIVATVTWPAHRLDAAAVLVVSALAVLLLAIRAVLAAEAVR